MNLYVVFTNIRGFLAADESSWSRDYEDAANFTSAVLAQEIAAREGEPDALIFHVING